MHPNVRRFAHFVVTIAAMTAAGWSVYTVARHFDAPELVALAAALVFDGVAYVCLALANEAAADGRSAFGARLSVLAVLGIAVYLNRVHADLVNGGLAAWLLYASPSVALLLLSELSWAGPRAAARRERPTDLPYKPPAFGAWAWLIAPLRAGSAVRTRAVQHIAGAGRTTEHSTTEAPTSEERTTADRDRSARGAIVRHFQNLDPVDAIKLGRESHPILSAAELASLLGEYGVIVTAEEVALVTGMRPPAVHVERPEQRTNTAHHAPQGTRPAPPMPHHPPAIGAPTKADAVRALREKLPPNAKSADIADQARTRYGLDLDQSYIRNVISRDRRKTSTPVTSVAPHPDRHSGPYL